MEGVATRGILSLLPVVVALLLAFRTKDAVFSLVIGCLLGVLLAGFDPATGLSKLFQNALGNADFIWVMMIEVAIGVMIALPEVRCHRGFAEWASTRSAPGGLPPGSVALGIFIFFSDYFSPLFSGPTARPLTDKYKVSRRCSPTCLTRGAPRCAPWCRSPDGRSISPDS